MYYKVGFYNCQLSHLVLASGGGGGNLCQTIRAVQFKILGFSGALQRLSMKLRKEEEGEEKKTESSSTMKPGLTQLQQIIHSHSTDEDGWEKCWEQGCTPWDLKQPTPILLHLHQTGALPLGRALVPGCGSGHDVVAFACPERYVVGLDLSESAIKKAKEPVRAVDLIHLLINVFGQLSSLSPNANHFTFLKADLFTWQPTELFDLIFDYTFFCAIEPDMRVSWARRMHDFLKPNGELLTLMFPIDDHVGGPPYKVSVADYEEVLHPMGFKAISIVDNEMAIGPRKGREKLGRWKRSLSPSLL